MLMMHYYILKSCMCIDWVSSIARIKREWNNRHKIICMFESPEFKSQNKQAILI